MTFSNQHKKKVDFTKHPAFGSWKDVKKSDLKLLKEIGGNWTNFPLKDSRHFEKISPKDLEVEIVES